MEFLVENLWVLMKPFETWRSDQLPTPKRTPHIYLHSSRDTLYTLVSGKFASSNRNPLSAGFRAPIFWKVPKTFSPRSRLVWLRVGWGLRCRPHLPRQIPIIPSTSAIFTRIPYVYTPPPGRPTRRKIFSLSFFLSLAHIPFVGVDV